MPSFFFADKIIHFFLYGGLAFLCAWSLRVTESAGYYVTPLLAAGLAIAYGAFDEIHQFFVPGRSCSVWDVAADATGATAGVIVAVIVAKICAGRRATIVSGGER